MSITVVVEERVAGRVAAEPFGPIGIPGPGRGRRAARDRRHADAVVSTLAAVPPGAVVLVRDVPDDPGVALIAAVGAVLGLPVLRLPADVEAAAWATSMMCAVDGTSVDAARAVAVLCGARCPAPGSAPPSSIRPATVTRWVARAWRRCRWCAGGGAAGARCPRCGTPIGAGA